MNINIEEYGKNRMVIFLPDTENERDVILKLYEVLIKEEALRTSPLKIVTLDFNDRQMYLKYDADKVTKC